MSEITVFVVFGSTGEYSDRSEWPIVAVQSEERAKSLVTQLDAKARELGISASQYKYLKNTTARYGADFDAAKEAMDAVLSGAIVDAVDYTGVRFYYTDVPFEVKQ